MKGYKGFNKDMKCNNFQYEVGKTYKHDGEARLCSSGFHFCENPLDVLSYYELANGNQYAEVEANGVSDEKSEDTKRVSKEINVKAKLDFKGLITAGIEFTLRKAKEKTSGDSANSATSGYYANSATSGYCAHSATSGYSAHSATSGYNSIACAIGRNSHAKSIKGNWLVLSEYDENFKVICVKTVKVDGKKIKTDTWYKLENKKFVEVKS